MYCNLKAVDIAPVVLGFNVEPHNTCTLVYQIGQLAQPDELLMI